MIEFTTVELSKLTTHQVGNKLRDEGIKFSSQEIAVDTETRNLLLKHFLSPFDGIEEYNFTHSSELTLNPAYVFIKRIFSNVADFQQNSIDLAKHLYEKSTHPKVNGGELSICLLENCIVNGIQASGIGLFKSEVKDTFLKFEPTDKAFNIVHQKGVNIKKLDKGGIVFNLEEEKGYKIFIIDSNKSKETQYWKDEFLNIEPTANNYHFTKNFLSITKDFVTKQLEHSSVAKPDRIDILNRSVDYFKQNESFEKADFEKIVFKDQQIIDSFREFNEIYNEHKEIQLSDSFEISSQAVKKQSKAFKSVLKLDRNFDIYIHGDRNLIEKGTEKDGRKFYKIYYQDEA